MNTRYLATWCALSLALGCYSDADYRGDGRFTDAGAGASHRFALDLGKVETGLREFSLSGLPSETVFMIGIEVAGLGPEAAARTFETSDAEIIVTVKKDSGEVVLEERTPLREWVWGGFSDGTEAVGYVREKAPVRSGAPSGTYFLTEAKSEYRLSLQVSTAADLEPYSPRLLLKGGGWKAVGAEG